MFPDMQPLFHYLLFKLTLKWNKSNSITCNDYFLKENLKTKSVPSRTECGEATDLEGYRIRVVGWRHIRIKPALAEDDDLDQEGGVEKEKEDRYPHL